MSRLDRMGDWFFKNDGPGPYGEDGLSNDDFDPDGTPDDFEFSLSFPQPPDRISQSARVVNGKLVVTVEFIFEDPVALDESDDED